MVPRRHPRTALLAPALAALASLSALAQVLVTPHAAMLVEGEECHYFAQVDGRPAIPCRWSFQVENGPEQPLGEGPMLAFKARRPEGVADLCTILARPAGDDRPVGIARVLVMKHDPFHLIRQAWGQDLLADRYSAEDKGFSRLEHGIPRFFLTMVPPLAHEAEKAVLHPFRDHLLGLPPVERLETLRRLTYSLGRERVRVDVTGETQVRVPRGARDHNLEILSAWPKGFEEPPGSVCRRFWDLPTVSRGVGDGTGRLPFKPSGLGGVSVCTQGTPEWVNLMLLADTEAGLVRMLSPQGEELAVWGQPGAPGAGSFDEGKVILSKPGFVNLTSRQLPGSGAWRHELMVSDPGNHAVYRLLEGGKAQTIGTPGQQGHRNGAIGQALFSHPRGCVQDLINGRAFVVDAGNGEIRMIDHHNNVTPLAGNHAAPREVRDGIGEEARFKDPAGLAWLGDANLELLVADDGCLRLVNVVDHSVRTVVGVPGRPSAREIEAGPQPLWEVPCLGRPFGLVSDPDGERIYITDTQYGTVRVWDRGSNSLRTLAGTGEGQPFRHGLLVDGTGGKGLPYACLTGIGHLAMMSKGSLLGTAPGHLALIGEPRQPLLAFPGIQILPGAPSVAVGQDLSLDIQVPLAAWPRRNDWTRNWELGPWLARPFTCNVFYAYPDGNWELATGTPKGVHGETLRFTARFHTPGEAEVRVLVVNDQGCSFLAKQKVQVTPAAAPGGAIQSPALAAKVVAEDPPSGAPGAGREEGKR